MSSFNKVIQIGRLTRDPETNFSEKGNQVTKFGFASDSGFGDNKKPMFIDVVCFLKTAEFVMKYFKKGNEILIEGALNFEQWDDKESGKKRSKHTITAMSVNFSGGKKDQDTTATQTENKQAPSSIEEDIAF